MNCMKLKLPTEPSPLVTLLCRFAETSIAWSIRVSLLDPNLDMGVMGTDRVGTTRSCTGDQYPNHLFLGPTLERGFLLLFT